VVVAFLTGRRVRVLPNAKAELTAEDVVKLAGKVEPMPAVGTVPALGAIAPGQAPGPRSGAIRVRSGSLWGAEVENLYPRDGAAAAAEATVLTFRNLVNAETCRVDVEDEMGETVFSVETRVPEVVVPAGVLVADKEYYWRVRTAGRRSLAGRGEALFVTLKAEDAVALQTFRASAEKDASPSALLLLADVYRTLGLFREACAALDRVAATEIGNPQVAKARTAFSCDEYGAAK
jgi:hypothetical protein